MNTEQTIREAIEKVANGQARNVHIVRNDGVAGKVTVDIEDYGVRVGSNRTGYTLYKMKPTEIVVWTDSHNDVRIGNKHEYSFVNLGKTEPKVLRVE